MGSHRITGSLTLTRRVTTLVPTVQAYRYGGEGWVVVARWLWLRGTLEYLHV